jgi:murein DD-endopeptidase MepM/ murein hydrolase activator NlpD
MGVNLLQRVRINKRRVLTIVAAAALAVPIASVGAAPANAWTCTSLPSAGNAVWGEKPYIGTATVGNPAAGTPDPNALFGCPNPAGRNHSGTDWDKAAANFNIHSVAAGTVEDRWNDPGCEGKYLVIRHGSGTGVRFSIYTHLSNLYVSAGDTVSAGQYIADSGGTGDCASGVDHLHFSMSSHWDETVSGRWNNAALFDSRAFLKARGVAVS